jgi:DNA-binding MarR family transcriptional regulator
MSSGGPSGGEDALDRPRRYLTDRMRAVDAAVTARVHGEVQRLAAPELRVPHARLMADLGPAARPSELARRLGVTKAAVAQLLAHLEAHGYVERMPDPGDARAALITPTARALAAYRVGRRALDEVEAEWEEVLGGERLRVLAECLELLDGWRQRQRHADGERPVP